MSFPGAGRATDTCEVLERCHVISALQGNASGCRRGQLRPARVSALLSVFPKFHGDKNHPVAGGECVCHRYTFPAPPSEILSQSVWGEGAGNLMFKPYHQASGGMAESPWESSALKLPLPGSPLWPFTCIHPASSTY